MNFNSRTFLMVCASCLILSGCASKTHRPAPVEDRTVYKNNNHGNLMGAATEAISNNPKSPPLGLENANKPGYRTVKPGDTLIRIGLEVGQHWKDLLKWNNLENANALEVGQVIKVTPPGADPQAVATRAVTPSKIETHPLDAPKVTTAATTVAASASAASAPTTVVSTPVASVTQDTAPSKDDLNWQWPASGPLLGSFEESKSKGLSIGGKAGDPVIAAADGRVVYAGSGLRGYGNLVIVKHNDSYLSAYAHNQKLWVKEDQSVRRGQKIADMGSSDSDKVQLHFEIRKQGKPVDPMKFLPGR
jgi:lipoprotein NlpD